MTIMDNDLFPRGGKVQTHKKEGAPKKRKNESLFKNTSVTKKKKKLRKKKFNPKDLETELTSRKEIKKAEKEKNSLASVEPLTYKMLAEGMNILCKVQEVKEMEILLSLPGRIQAMVPITSISTPYSALLNRLANNEDLEVKGLKELFTAGMVMPCNIKQVTQDGSYRVFASLNPADIIKDIPVSALTKGMKVAAAVQSVEDHGYVMDIGIVGVRSFMSKESEKDLVVGEIVQCYITQCQIDGHVGTLTLSTTTTIKFKQNVELNTTTLIPGTNLHVNIKKVTVQGLMVSIGNLMGYIHKDHLAKQMDDMAGYSKNPNLVAVVLYTLPLMNSVYLSLQPALVKPVQNGNAEAPLAIGRIFDAAVVVESTSAGLFVQLKKKTMGFIPLRHLDDNRDAIEDVKAHHPVKSRKRCRVLQYSCFDGVYICTMKKSLLNAKYLRYEDFSVGQFVEATIDCVLPAGVSVSVGVNLKGFIHKLHWADDPRLKRPELRFKVGGSVTCRVLKNVLERKSLYLTCKNTLVVDKGPIYQEPSQLEKKTALKGTVALIQTSGLLITFYGDLTGWIPLARLAKRGLSERSFFLGQIVSCVVESVSDVGKVVLDLDKSGYETAQTDKGLGSIVECRVVKVNAEEGHRGLEVNIPEMKINGFIPVEHLSDFPQLCSDLLNCYRVGDSIEQAVVWDVTKVETMITVKPTILRWVIDNRFPRSFDDIVVNSIFPCVSTHKQDFGVFATLLCPPSNVDVLFPKTKMPSSLLEAFAGGLKHATMEGKVVTVDADKKNVALSLLKADGPQHARDTLDSYFHDLNRIKNHLANSDDEKLKYLANLAMGDSVVGKTLSVDAATGVEFQLAHGLIGIVPVYHQDGKTFKSDDIVVGCVLFSDVLQQRVYVSTRAEIVGSIVSMDKKALAPKDQQLKGTNILNVDLFSLVLIDDDLLKSVAYTSNMMNLNDSSDPMPSPFPVGDAVTVVVDATATVQIASYPKKPQKWKKTSKRQLKKSESADSPSKKKAKKNPKETGDKKTETPVGDDVSDPKKKAKKNPKKTANTKPETTADVELSETSSPDAPPKKMAKKDAKKTLDIKVAVEKPTEKTKKTEKKPVVEEKNPVSKPLPRLQVSSAFDWDESEASQARPAVDSSSDSEDDEAADTDKVVVKDRRERAKQKLEEARLAELKLSLIEESLTDPQRAPVTADDFDRMVMSSPNSSILWLQYMAFHLENAEIEKARCVAQRALKTIIFREEQEKFNVWIAWLNLEHMYGTTEGYEQLFEEALRCNEPVKVYRQMALNFEQSGKIDEAESLYTTLLKKFKHDKSVWLNACLFYIKNSKLATARTVFQKSLLSLAKKEHIYVISRFAQLEVKYGEVERGKTMFDTLMVSYPKRTDLWLVYIDTLIKAGHPDSARQVLERSITLQLPAKKMKTMFQKFLEFETQHGSEERQNYVRQKALEYVEAKSEAKE